MTYSEIESYSLGMGDMHNVTNSLQPHISFTETEFKSCARRAVF